MKKTSSLVWRFFDRVEENNRCVSVLCKLCDQHYKYFGNTTNLRTHLVNKHPIQWELLQNGSLEESTFRSAFEEDESSNQTTPRTKRRKYTKSYKDDNVHNAETSEAENENNDNIETEEIFVEQISNNRGSDEEWLNDEIYETVETFEPKRRKTKYKQIKREVQSPTPKLSNYIVRTPVQYQKPERVVVDTSPRKDEYTVFGEYIANKIRKVKAPQTRSNVQQLITTILWQAEFGVYDNMDTVRRVIMHSVTEMAPQDTVVVEHVEIPSNESKMVSIETDTEPKDN